MEKKFGKCCTNPKEISGDVLEATYGENPKEVYGKETFHITSFNSVVAQEPLIMPWAKGDLMFIINFRDLMRKLSSREQVLHGNSINPIFYNNLLQILLGNISNTHSITCGFVI